MKRPRLVRGRGLVALLAAPLLLAACSLDNLNPLAAASPTPSPVTPAGATPSASAVSNQGATSAASRLPVTQDLAFDGAVTGKADKAVTSCGGSNGQWNAALIAKVGGVDLTVYMTLIADKGPGKYQAKNDDGTINIAVHTASIDYLGDSGGFNVADDHRSGDIDTTFTGGLHLAGKWACAST